MDGTCLNSAVALSPENRAALEAAARAGVVVVPTTGRVRGMLPPEVVAIPGIRYAITSGGAVLDDIEAGEQLLCNAISKEDVRAVKALLDAEDTEREAYIDGRQYIKQSDYDKLGDYLPHAYLPLFEKTSEVVPDAVYEELAEKRPVEKVNFRFPLAGSPRREAVFDALREIPGLLIIDQPEGNGEITAREADKGTALAALANHLGVDCSEVMAIGDGLNDTAMLRFAGTGVAMGQAAEAVKACADAVTGTNDENGVAQAVERFILGADRAETPSDAALSEKVRRANAHPPVVYVYPKCSTCKKALNWLKERGVAATVRDITTDGPDRAQLLKILQNTKFPVKRFFNTSGQQYRELGLKDKIEAMSREEAAALLAENPMLIRRPLIIAARGSYPGFKPEAWEALLS